MMIQSIHQPSHMAYAAQPHAPSNFVVLAKIQQHETSEHQGKPQSVVVALLLSSDSVFVGSAIQSKVDQTVIPCFQHQILLLCSGYRLIQFVLYIGHELDK